MPFQAVLMDTWYATKELMLWIEMFKKFSYCPLKDNRQVDDAGDRQAYRRVDSLAWSPDALEHGKRIKIKGFPKDHKVATVPGCGVSPPHGLRCDQRVGSTFH